MRSDEQILALWHERSMAEAVPNGRRAEIQRLYNGDDKVPLPEVDKVEKSAVANLIRQGIDQLGARVSSVAPDVDCPSIDPGAVEADKLARQRRLAILGWWDRSMMDVLDGRRARHLLAFAASPVHVRPGHSKDRGLPTWHVRNPMVTFPGHRPNPDDMTPDDCIFAYEVTLGFLMNRYPDAANSLEKGENPRPDDKFEILEYIDHDELVMLAVGKNRAVSTAYGAPQSYGAPLANIYRQPNKAGMCTVVVPRRTSLDTPIGKFDDMAGMHEMQAKLMALTYIAIRENVFSKEWLVGRAGELPEVLTEADPMNGRTGVVTGGTLEPQTLNPSPMSMQMMGQLEQNQRQQGGLPAEMGGTSPTNVRTGKRGMDIMSAQIDFPIQEAQTILARSKEAENVAAIAISKGYFGDKTVSFYVRKMKGDKGKVTYVPNEIFDTDVNFVDYPNAGSDANQLAVLIGQLVSLELISEETGRKLHPLIDDPHHEAEKVITEALQKALLASIVAAVQQGTLGPVDVAAISIALDEDRSTLAQAVQAVHAAEQARQAAQPPAAEAGAPGLAPGPGGAPGGAALPPGQVPPAVGPPSPSTDNLAALLGQLHAPPQAMANA